MKNLRLSVIVLLVTVMIFGGCASWNRTQKGAVIGTAAGGTTGAVIGRASGNTALGAIIGAAVGGTAGAVIGNQMERGIFLQLNAQLGMLKINPEDKRTLVIYGDELSVKNTGFGLSLGYRF